MANSVARLCFAAMATLFAAVGADEPRSFSFGSFGKDPNFEARVTLYGAARVVNGGSAIRLVDSLGSSPGGLVFKKPIKVVGGKEWYSASFSSYFSFSLSGGGVLGFVMLPGGSNISKFDGFDMEVEKNQSGVVSVEFDASMNEANYGDASKNHVAMKVGGVVSAKISNLSSVNVALNSGEKLHSWVDYEASSKRIEVRLSRSSRTRPIDPLISYTIDLSEVWKDRPVFMGLSSSNGTCFVYSWAFRLRHYPRWMHSEPLDPDQGSKKLEPSVPKKGGDCFAKIVGALFAGLAGGALAAVLVLYLWFAYGGRRPIPVVPEEYAGKANGFKKVDQKVEEDGK